MANRSLNVMSEDVKCCAAIENRGTPFQSNKRNSERLNIQLHLLSDDGTSCPEVQSWFHAPVATEEPQPGPYCTFDVVHNGD